ncbi:hypothetical protein APHNP_1391 [Anaplasma phagocytophilum str. ApNP]|uniref:Uncharacterized protein n=1 Tax=Anaplasma phagocytophilum str. ApNP TaxID=1359153 RepID=A0A0F3NGH7_ANAPH|nr:hypothetical protein APHNP_1391 [Anaplasma phagocytophilum str. ApNP]
MIITLTSWLGIAGAVWYASFWLSRNGFTGLVLETRVG